MSEHASAEIRTDGQAGGRHFRRMVYRAVLVQRDGDGGLVAGDDCIAISRPLLALAAAPAEWIYPAEQIHSLLWGPDVTR